MSRDEFEKRDEMGLDKSAPPKTEAEARAGYFRMLGTVIFVQSPILGWVAYFCLRFLPGQAERMDAKFAFLVQHDLGWVFVAILTVLLMKSYMVINSNGGRAAARLDRPDQHIYKIMSKETTFSDAPYVLMATTGAAGRFNRAQRAAFNADESLPVFLVSLVSVAAVFGPAAVVTALITLLGRVKFAESYKEDQDKRSSGFMIAIVGEYITIGLVWVCALKSFIPGLP